VNFDEEMSELEFLESFSVRIVVQDFVSNILAPAFA